MKIIHWIGIDDHADKWTIAHLRGSEEKPSKEFELIPNEAGYRKLLAFAKALGGTVRPVTPEVAGSNPWRPRQSM